MTNLNPNLKKANGSASTVVERVKAQRNKFLSPLVLVLLFLLSTKANSGEKSAPNRGDQAGIPATPIGELLRAFLASINSQEPHTMRSFVSTHFGQEKLLEDAWPTACCLHDQITRTLVNVSRRSRGLNLKEVHAGETEIVAFATTNSDGRRIYINLQSSQKDTARIASYQLVADPADPGEILPPVESSSSPEWKMKVARKAIKKAASRDLFSGTVLIAHNRKILLRAAFGEADRESHVANTPDTVFSIASMGKLFTAVAVAQLSSQGKLNYDAPILRYLPEYPNRHAASKITLRQLLTHTSGLADIFAKSSPAFPLHQLRDYYPLFANDALLFEPGKGQRYSNTGLLVASMIVEAVSGEEFRLYLKKHVFKPAGMIHTGWGHPAGLARPYAKQFDDDPLAPDKPWVSAEPFYKNLLGGAAAGQGGELSTVDDLFNFAIALQTGRLLSPEEFNVLIQNGFGCQCSALPGQRVYSHGGGGPGIDTGFKLYVDRNWVVIYLSNYSPPFPQMLLNRIEDLAIPK